MAILSMIWLSLLLRGEGSVMNLSSHCCDHRASLQVLSFQHPAGQWWLWEEEGRFSRAREKRRYFGGGNGGRPVATMASAGW